MAITGWETLIRNNPKKTAKELLEIHEAEKIAEDKRIAEEQKDINDFIEDINNNGYYTKGTFGLEQYYIRRIFNASNQFGTLTADVESIVIFDRQDGSFHAERRIKEYEDLSRFGLSTDKRTTVEEWNDVCDSLNRVRFKHWKTIKFND